MRNIDLIIQILADSLVGPSCTPVVPDHCPPFDADGRLPDDCV